MALAFIAFGANLSRPLDTLNLMEMAFVDYMNKVRILNRSALYCSVSLIGTGQPLYYNGAFSMKTELAPLALLRLLKFFECGLGRSEKYKQHWGPRSLDLDILLYDQLIFHSPELTIPHPRLHERHFVRVPLSEIYPTFLETTFDRYRPFNREENGNNGSVLSSSLPVVGHFDQVKRKWRLSRDCP